MTGPLRWPRRRDWPRWLVASIDPERPAEITAPIPVRQCAVCAQDDRHVWSEVDAERIGAVVLRRLACVCDRCGRCDAQITEVHVDRGSAAMTSVPGLGKLIDEYDGNPATLRWLSIHPDGRVVDRESDNRIGWSTQHEMWVQWRLVRDVYREVEPTSHGYSLSVAVLIPTRHGVVTTARDNSGLVNPVATGMLAALGVEHETRGTVAWRAEAHAETGLHGDLDDEHRAALRALATQHGGTSGRAEWSRSCKRSSMPPMTARHASARAARKGWLPAFRDAVLFKVAYAYGLRRNEVRMLDVHDFGRNPHAEEFGSRGVTGIVHATRCSDDLDRR